MTNNNAARKQVINGLTYNTETADEICTVGSIGTSYSDFRDWTATLYRTPRGRFFMAGEGGPMSPFARPYGTNGSIGGEGIIALHPAEALAYAEGVADADTIAAFFDVEDA